MLYHLSVENMEVILNLNLFFCDDKRLATVVVPAPQQKMFAGLCKDVAITHTQFGYGLDENVWSKRLYKELCDHLKFELVGGKEKA
jgi:hypothetical protein